MGSAQRTGSDLDDVVRDVVDDYVQAVGADEHGRRLAGAAPVQVVPAVPGRKRPGRVARELRHDLRGPASHSHVDADLLVETERLLFHPRDLDGRAVTGGTARLLVC